MCGIFGVIRHGGAPSPDLASRVFVELGRLAVSRGRDAAGFALHTPPAGPATRQVPDPGSHGEHALGRDVTVDGIRIIKDTRPFDEVWVEARHRPPLAAARVALGHTRWATQGRRDAMANASPMIAGYLVGTHNGDIDVDSLPHPRPAATRGDTDTERLLLALHAARRDRRRTVQVLRGVEGRAALAWIDRSRPHRVYLARAALSPLALAWDREGNLYWASNPDWFRRIDTALHGAAGFHQITLVREGTLLTVDLSAAAPQVIDRRHFVPRARPRDRRLGDHVVWRDFHLDDIAADKAQAHHAVAPLRAGTPNTAPAAAAVGRRPARRPAPRGLAAALAAEEPDLWAAPADPHPDVDDEVSEALLVWAEEGCNPRVVASLQDPLTPARARETARAYGLSGPEAAHRFRTAVLSWDT